MKIVIIGGVAGGATSAARLRRISEDAEIILFERGEHISYANCGLPYYIGGVIPEREKLFVQTPEAFSKRFNIDVRVRNEVIGIDRKAKTVTVKRLADGTEYAENYDRIILSPGAEPIVPPIPGIQLPDIFTVRNVADTDKIKAYLEEKQPRRAVIVGAGFIGLEMAENFHSLGIQVTIVEMANQVMNILDYEMAAAVHQHLKIKNVEFYLADGVSAFEASDAGTIVRLKSGKVLKTDIVVLSIGVRPETSLAEKSGLELGKSGGIKVNSYMQTSDPDVFAAGDAIEFPHRISGASLKIPLAGPANKQARIIADNIIYGAKHEFKGAIGTGIAKVFDLTVASTGYSEKQLNAAGIPSSSVITHSGSHAGYYPGSIPMTLKTIFDPETGKILGAQAVGYQGVDKRIDVLATAIGFGGTVFDLQEIEHAYAPPFSSAKDPVNISGFVAGNLINGITKQVHWHEVFGEKAKKWLPVDVRNPEEFSLGSIPGAVNYPLDELRERYSELKSAAQGRNILLFCGVGLRAYVGERILRQKGFDNVFNLAGGYKTYSLATMKQSNEDIFGSDYVGKDEIIYQTNPDAVGTKIIELDSCGLQCPGPIQKLKQQMDELVPGDRIIQKATDPGFAHDIQSWCNLTGNTLIKVDQDKGVISALIEKASPRIAGGSVGSGDGMTFVVFSDDMDKALASFVMANGAAASGKPVTMFFTFWGLNVIKKRKTPRVKKDFMGRMFSLMLPGSSKKLKLSKMNMGGMGTAMMRMRMKSLNIDSLETMIESAVAAGVRMVGCQMSMDVMGVKKEELLDNVEIGGVATYLEAGSKAHSGLFV